MLMIIPRIYTIWDLDLTVFGRRYFTVQFLRHNRGEGLLKTTNVREFEGEPLVTTGGLTQCCHVRHNEETGLRSLIGVCKALVLLDGTKKD